MQSFYLGSSSSLYVDSVEYPFGRKITTNDNDKDDDMILMTA